MKLITLPCLVPRMLGSVSSPHALLVRYWDASSPYLISLDILNAGAIFFRHTECQCHYLAIHINLCRISCFGRERNYKDQNLFAFDISYWRLTDSLESRGATLFCMGCWMMPSSLFYQAAVCNGFWIIMRSRYYHKIFDIVKGEGWSCWALHTLIWNKHTGPLACPISLFI